MRRVFSPCQTFGEFVPRPVEPGFYGSGRTVQDPPDFRATEFLLVKEDEAHAILFSQVTEGRLQFLAEFPNVGARRSGGKLLYKFGSGRLSRPRYERGTAAIGCNRQ